MWNYPDGITGNEPQIAGYPEPTSTRIEIRTDNANRSGHSVSRYGKPTYYVVDDDVPYEEDAILRAQVLTGLYQCDFWVVRVDWYEGDYEETHLGEFYFDEDEHAVMAA